MRRLILRVLVVVVVVVVALVVVAMIVLGTSWGQEKLADLAAERASRFVNGEVSIGRIEGDLFRSPRLHDVVISRDGEPIVSVDRIDVQYDPLAVAGGQVAIDQITLTRPVIHLEPGERGLSLLELVQPGDGPPQRQPRAMSISPILIVDGRVVIDPRLDDFEWLEAPAELTDLDARFGLSRTSDAVRVDVDALSFTSVDPRLRVQEFTGELVFGGGDLTLEHVVLTTQDSQLTMNATLQDLFGRRRPQ